MAKVSNWFAFQFSKCQSDLNTIKEYKMLKVLVAGIVGLGLLASPSLAGDLSGTFRLTAGKFDFKPTSQNPDDAQ